VRVGFNNCALRREHANRRCIVRKANGIAFECRGKSYIMMGRVTAAKKSEGRAKMSYAVPFLFSCGNLAFQVKFR
jgi:hypothetical protein